MQIFDYNEFSQDMAKVFNTALVEEVIVNNKDGNSYKLLPIKKPVNRTNIHLKIFFV
jgi:hypothetical protein